MASKATSGLVAALEVKAPELRRGNPCSVDAILRSLTEAERAVVQARIDEWRAGTCSEFQSPRWLAEVLTENGYPIGRQSVYNHMRKACRCGY